MSGAQRGGGDLDISRQRRWEKVRGLRTADRQQQVKFKADRDWMTDCCVRGDEDVPNGNCPTHCGKLWQDSVYVAIKRQNGCGKCCKKKLQKLQKASNKSTVKVVALIQVCAVCTVPWNVLPSSSSPSPVERQIKSVTQSFRQAQWPAAAVIIGQSQWWWWLKKAGNVSSTEALKQSLALVLFVLWCPSKRDQCSVSSLTRGNSGYLLQLLFWWL